MERKYKDKVIHSEEYLTAKPHREVYLSSVERLIARKRAQSKQIRSQSFAPEQIFADREGFRKKYIGMLGYPLTEYREGLCTPTVTKEFTARDGMGEIYRMHFEVMEDFIFYGMLFLPDGFDEKRRYPLIVSQHGGGGTPELCSDFFGDTNYTHMTRRVLERGAVVFAPQLLLWGAEQFGPDYNRIAVDNKLKQLGGSITALEIFCIMRCLDYFAAQPYIDRDKIGMVGLSYGGFYTLMTAAADTRIKSAYSSCFFNDRFVYDWGDWTWFNAANSFLDAEIAALVAPRRLLIEVGKSDDLFAVANAQIEYERLNPFFAECPAQLRFSAFAGGHELDGNEESMEYFFEGLYL